MDSQIEALKEYTKKLEDAYKEQKTKILSMSQAVSSSSTNHSNEGIVKLRLDWELDKIKLEHFLAGDIKVFDENNSEVWIENPNEEERTFNKRGVRLIMEQLELFTLRNNILSRYELERINKILLNLGIILADFLFDNAEELGMDTRYKQSKYKLVILNTIYILEGAYRRALGGAESEANAPNLSVTQIHNPSYNELPFANQNSQKRNWKWI